MKGEEKGVRYEKMDVESDDNQESPKELIKGLDETKTHEQRERNSQMKEEQEWKIQRRKKPNTNGDNYNDPVRKVGQLKQQEEKVDDILQRTDNIEQELEDQNQSNRKRKKEAKEVNKADNKRFRDKQGKDN